MKLLKYIYCFAFILTSIFNLNAEEQCSEWVPGAQWENQISEAYSKGQYDFFLQQLDTRYEKGKEANEWQDMLKAIDGFLQSPEFAENAKQTVSEFQKEIDQLIQKTHTQLLEVANQSPDLAVSQIIQDVVNARQLTPEETEAAQFFSNLCYPLTQENNAVLIKLQEIAKEYYIKHSLLFMEAKVSNFPNWTDCIDKNAIEEYAVVIKLSNMQKMLAAAQNDEVVRAKLEKALASYRKQIAKSHNWKYLEALGQKKIAPKNQTEEQVGAIMAQFLSEKRALVQKFYSQKK